MYFIINRLQPMPRITDAPSAEAGPEPDRVEIMADLFLARA
jgi:hypothetical protein